MVASPEVDKFACRLRMLKERNGAGFSRLGKLTGVSGSTLHRYCSGHSVPADYRVVHTFAKVCGATAEELREVHRLWALADAGKSAPPAPAPEEPPVEPRRAWSRTALTPRYAALVLGLLLVGGLVWSSGGSAAAPDVNADKPLFAPGCSAVRMGRNDECVRELQSLLQRAKGKLVVDGAFGPETLRRVTAFQVLADLPPTGTVDTPTKNALYAQDVDMATWSPDEVEGRIRAVFVERPDLAVAIARCASFLDPQWVLPNTNGTRNWGVFQLSDARLRDLDGTPLRALDPAWNIEAAHRLWSARHDFHDWPSCEAAAAPG
ncbi:MAG: helix-turn-helix domain-containing protein [Umezawaea sp.]